MTDLIIRTVVGALVGAAIFHWGYRTGRKRERERTEQQIDRLWQEGRLSSTLRILTHRLRGDEDYDEPRTKK